VRPEKLWQKLRLFAYPPQVRQEQGRRMNLRAAELMPLAFRSRAADPAPVIFRREAPLKMAVSVAPAEPFRLAARGARVLQQAAVTLRAAAGSCRGRDAQRGQPLGAS
jgi:hypothetical protein